MDADALDAVRRGVAGIHVVCLPDPSPMEAVQYRKASGNRAATIRCRNMNGDNAGWFHSAELTALERTYDG